MHPSGRSYAALARARAGTPEAWSPTHVRAFHVLELAALRPADLEPGDRALAAIGVPGWEALTRGDRLVLTSSALVVAERGPFGLAKLRVYPRAAWDAFSDRSAIALVPRTPPALCTWPASTELCWQPRSSADRHRAALLVSTVGSASLVVLASIALVIAFGSERRRAHADRIHVLRTLTHELRTPATSLRLDIEPLRSAYDALPTDCQEPLLRLSDGIERLHRVLHRSARYMALFETNAKAESLVSLREVPSAQAMFEELSEEWPEGVVLRGASPDGPVRTDREWLGVALKNLVENGVRHGALPVSVTWALTDGLVVRVSDGGATPKLSLRRAVRPYERDPKSPGLGLGLAIAERVARLLGGRLVHEPSPTVFELRLPRTQQGGAS
jgi:signal transduction histidine kinase